MAAVKRRVLWACATVAWTAWGCTNSTGSGDAGPTVGVNVAALNLQGVGDVVWDVEVQNGADPAQVVWQRRLSSSGYGDGAGSASYVGPCDADPAASTNKVRVWVVGVYSAPVTALGTFSSGAVGGATGTTITFNNPTADGTPLEKSVLCQENVDAHVQFDVSLARPAEQGFFDVAVSFEDIFCSAKLDCEDDAGADLDLLHTASGGRDMTAVLGFACTASPTGTTFLYMDDPKIVCAGQAPLEVKVDASGQGNVDFGQAPNANPGGYLFAASVYRGVEGLANKAYWNISFGLDATKFAALGACTLTGRATASKQALPQAPGGFPLPEGTVYPVIDWSVQLSDGAGRTCQQHEVNANGSGVATNYVGYMAAPNQFSWQTEIIYLENRFEPLTGVVLKKTGFSCNPSCAHGSCSGVDTCDCTGTGYSGATCATPVCTTLCANGGVCSAPDTCDCTGTGYEGATCETDVDECTLGTDDCDTNATCANGVGSFSCTCTTGYEGSGQVCTDIDGCAAEPCAGGVSCTDVAAPGTGRTCGACPSGQWGDGASCTACTAVAGCTGTLSCTSAADSVCSSCAAGYEQLAPGAECTDVDECLTSNGGCDGVAACGNTAGGWTCTCPAGTFGDGFLCTACPAGEVQPNPGQLSCVACGAGTYDDATEVCATCSSCSAGQYVASACVATGNTVCAGCTAIANCTSGLTCTSDSNSQCSNCAAGYDEPTCGNINDCSPNPCLNGGTCTDGVDSYTCSCTNGYTGTDCEIAPQPSGFSCTGTVCSNATTGEVWVPQGDFWMGCNSVLDANCEADESAQHRVTLSSYAIDQTEVTAAEYAACVSAGGCTAACGGGNATYGVSGKEQHPVNCVSWSQSGEYCAWNKPGAGVQRLCTEAEWEKAARGGCDTVAGDCSTGAQMRKYPWGATEPTCGNSLANFNSCVGSTTAVGAYPAGASPYGAYDMSGNVFEWVYDWYAGTYAAGAVIDPQGPGPGSFRVKLGGDFAYGAAAVRASERNNSPPSVAHENGGFRCCRSTCTLDADCASGEICSASACIDDPCAPNPCQNGGTCSAATGGYTCACPNGYTGKDCEVAPPSGFACVGKVCENATTGEVWVPAGAFWMGCNNALDGNCAADEYSQHRVTLSAYAIDRTEVTAAEYAACVSAGGCTAAGGGGYATYGVSGKEQHPVNYVNWSQSGEYCAWNKPGAGVQRLCTEAEWEKAARGGCDTVTGDCSTGAQMRKYPWGATEPTCGNSLANFGNCVGTTTAVGAYPAGASPYGALDMAGNVWDWVYDSYDSSYAAGAVTNPTGPATGSPRVIRGGFFAYAGVDARASERRPSNESNAFDDIGFRCCRSTF